MCTHPLLLVSLNPQPEPPLPSDGKPLDLRRFPHSSGAERRLNQFRARSTAKKMIGVHLGVTGFNADNVFKAYDRKSGRFIDLGYKPGRRSLRRQVPPVARQSPGF